MADEEATPEPVLADGHVIDGHTVVIHNGTIFVDNTQATLGRPDMDVTDILRQFFEHLRDESKSEDVNITPGDERIYGDQVFDAGPAATIIINIGR